MQDDMAIAYQAASSSSSSSVNVCYRYAVVRDVATRTDIDVCSSTDRVSAVAARVRRSVVCVYVCLSVCSSTERVINDVVDRRFSDDFVAVLQVSRLLHTYLLTY